MAEKGVPETVLVVDDDAQMRRLLARLMRLEGFTCEVAATVAEATMLLERALPDLVLLDLHLPDGSGMTLARELASRPSGPVVLMVTGEDDPGVARIALDAGAFGYVTKPFKRNEVTIAVETAMRRRRAENENRERRTMLEDTLVERTAAVQEAQGRLLLAQGDTAIRLAQAIDLRDHGTATHLERMSEYCAILSPGFGLDPDVMRTASRLHDIGKIAVPDAILQKPGPLTAQERAQAERHAEMGHRLLAGSGSEVLEVAATIAWTHHERFDGTGYPRALAGEDIPLAGRVAAVADVFDALTSDRVYRRAFAVADAQEMLESERGGQFDPAVVDAFLAAMDEIRGIMARVVDDADVPATPGADAERLLTLQEAAMAVGVSASTMRRWADDGRIRAIRTAGGHRRFALDAVRQMAADRGPRAVVRPILPPVEPLPLLSRQLRDAGEDMAARAAASLYREGPRGWFAGPDGEMAIQAWLSDLVLACDTGRHTRALEAAETLMRRADVQGVSLLERHGFLERFGEVSVRVLSREQAPRPEILGARRLFVAMQQALLAGC